MQRVFSTWPVLHRFAGKKKSTSAGTAVPECRYSFLARWHGADEEYMTDDIVIWGQGSGPGGGGRGTNKVPSSGAPVFINKHHLFFSAGDKISSYWGE